jgi:O-antigen ligase
LIARRANVGKVCDRAIIALILVQTVLTFREASVTAVLRVAVVYTLTIGIPYFAVSRGVRSMEEARVVLMAFVVAALPLAMVGIFEVSKSWLLYPSVPMSWGIELLTPYVERDGMLRATASTAQPIALGYTLMAALGCLLAVRIRVPDTRAAWLALGLLTGGLASSLSRGPWLGAVLMLLVLIMMGPHRLKNIGKLLCVAICMSPLLLTPSGDRILRLLPFVGSVEPGSVEYRNKLIENAVAVIRRSPLTGVADFTETAEMQEMLQGQGIIDVTNTYLQIALKFGLLGLGGFVIFFSALAARMGMSLRAVPSSELSLPALFATLIAILFTIVTVSSISFIPYIYWMFAGLSIGLLRSIGRRTIQVAADEASLPRRSGNAGIALSSPSSTMRPARFRL